MMGIVPLAAPCINSDDPDHLQSPEIMIDNRIDQPLNGRTGFASHGYCLNRTAGHLSARVDPGAERLDFVLRDRTGRRHLETDFRADQPLYQLALGCIARHDDHAVIAAPERVLPEIEPQAGLLLARPVAAEAAF
jgi:hypothetical protein